MRGRGFNRCSFILQYHPLFAFSSHCLSIHNIFNTCGMTISYVCVFHWKVQDIAKIWSTKSSSISTWVTFHFSRFIVRQSVILEGFYSTQLNVMPIQNTQYVTSISLDMPIQLTTQRKAAVGYFRIQSPIKDYHKLVFLIMSILIPVLIKIYFPWIQ